MKIGRHTYIGEPHNITASVEIGSFSSIAPNVQMHNLPQHHKGITTFPLKGLPEPKVREGKIIIGNDVWIGQGAILLGPLTIGDGAIIGAYSVLAKDAEPYGIYIGNPAKAKYLRFKWDYGFALYTKIKWWDWSDKLIEERIEDFKLPIEEFIKKYLPDKLY